MGVLLEGECHHAGAWPRAVAVFKRKSVIERTAAWHCAYCTSPRSGCATRTWRGWWLLCPTGETSSGVREHLPPCGWCDRR